MSLPNMCIPKYYVNCKKSHPLKCEFLLCNAALQARKTYTKSQVTKWQMQANLQKVMHIRERQERKFFFMQNRVTLWNSRPLETRSQGPTHTPSLTSHACLLALLKSENGLGEGKRESEFFLSICPHCAQMYLTSETRHLRIKNHSR